MHATETFCKLQLGDECSPTTGKLPVSCRILFLFNISLNELNPIHTHIRYKKEAALSAMRHVILIANSPYSFATGEKY
jgi:hypothetical protein